jgi:hypothetical protein
VAQRVKSTAREAKIEKYEKSREIAKNAGQQDRSMGCAWDEESPFRMSVNSKESSSSSNEQVKK